MTCFECGAETIDLFRDVDEGPIGTVRALADWCWCPDCEEPVQEGSQ